MRKLWLFLFTVSLTITILSACSDDQAEKTAGANGQDQVLQYQSTPGQVCYFQN